MGELLSLISSEGNNERRVLSECSVCWCDSFIVSEQATEVQTGRDG